MGCPVALEAWMTVIRDKLLRVRERIEQAAGRAGRASDEIALVAVTKTVGVSQIEEAIKARVTDIGENYVQDSLEKFNRVGRRVRWHMIGHMQTNKARQAVGVFDLIQSVDSLRLAEEIGKRSVAIDKTSDVLIEVNISSEESKFGAGPAETLDLAAQVSGVTGVRLLGLMGIAPFTDDEGAIRKSFRRLKGLWDGLPAEQRRWLSMGMTSDFEVAIEEGSNMVRIGTAIFGPRG
jgi:hypothetical protein